MSLNGNGNWCWNSPEMPANTWFKLKIGQYYDDKKYKYKIWIDDEHKKTVVNNEPMIFENVNVIFGNGYQPERDYQPVAGQFKNFNFASPHSKLSFQKFNPPPPQNFHYRSNSLSC